MRGENLIMEKMQGEGALSCNSNGVNGYLCFFVGQKMAPLPMPSVLNFAYFVNWLHRSVFSLWS